jgi:phosphoglycolate phosphatase
MIRLAVFDLDGTLVDSRRDLANAANALVAGLGGRPLSEEAIGGMVGEGAAVLVRRVLTAAKLDPDAPGALPRFLELYDQRLTEHTVPYGGVVEALAALAARMPLAVLTNKPQAATDRLLESLDLAPYFGRVVGGDSRLGRKPEPAGLLSLCTGAGVLPEEATLIGDSPVDLETARRAGTQVLLVSYGFGFRFDPAAIEAVAVADAPSEIPKHIGS